MIQAMIQPDTRASLISRLTKTPKAGRLGARSVADLLESEESADLRALLVDAPQAADLLAGIAEGAPYLWRLMSRWPERVAPFLAEAPETSLEAIFGETRAAGSLTDAAAAMRVLRHGKAKAALLIALADLGGVFDTVEVTTALSDFADASVQGALRFGLNEAMRGTQISPSDPENPESGLGLFVLALGKHGARELNYSSDIDLAVFYDPEQPGIASASDRKVAGSRCGDSNATAGWGQAASSAHTAASAFSVRGRKPRNW